MTLKSWNDWQKRIGETKQIWYCDNESKYKKGLLNNLYGEKIIHIDFNKDIATITYQRKHQTFKGSWHIENCKITIERQNIVTIEYKN